MIDENNTLNIEQSDNTTNGKTNDVLEITKAKLEVALLKNEQQEIINGITKAKYELKADVTELLAKQNEALAKHQELVMKQQDELRELRIYKWVVRVALLFFLGGSIWGLLKYQDLIDDRIALRIMRTEQLNLALSHANAGMWRQSLVELDSVWNDMRSAKTPPTPEYRSFIFANLLWVLPQVEDRLPGGNWVGENEWKALSEDKDFRTEFITGDRWSNDEVTNNYIALCVLKFDHTAQALDIAQGYFQRSLESSRPEQRKAPHYFALAMIDLIKANTESALVKLREAERLNPASYRLEDYNKYSNSFINSSEFFIWQSVARTVGAAPFENTYSAFLHQISTLKP